MAVNYERLKEVAIQDDGWVKMAKYRIENREVLREQRIALLKEIIASKTK